MSTPKFDRELYRKAISNLSGDGQFYILLLLSKIDNSVGNTDIAQLLSPLYDISVFSVNNIIHRFKLQGLVADTGESNWTREQFIQKDFKEIYRHLFAPIEENLMTEIVETYKKRRAAGELHTQIKKATTRQKSNEG